MYTRKRKPNWFLWCMIAILILLYIVFLLILSDPIKVVSYDQDGTIIEEEVINRKELIDYKEDKENNKSPFAGCIKTQYDFLDSSLSENTHQSEVVVTGCQQDLSNIKYGDCLYNTLLLDYYDIYLLAKIVQCEAGNQNKDAKIAVATVVLNRVLSDKFPDTVEEVILENHDGVYQFTPCMDGGSWWYKEPTYEDFEAIDTMIYLGYTTDALWFESCIEESWHTISDKIEYDFTEGDIRFYKEK